MGFDTVVAAIMVTAVIVTVAYTFLAGSTTIAELSVESYKDAVTSAVKKLKSDILILNVTYDNSTSKIIAYIKNAGEEKYPDFKDFDVIVYGKTSDGRMLSTYVSSPTFTILNELINPGIFDPHEVAEVETLQPLSNGTYVLLVCTPNAVCDSLDFTV